jgi:DNA-binding MarR family transcriptional regulator
MVSLRKIVRFLRLADREAEAAVGLSAAQLFVLQTLANQPAASLAEVAERTLTDQSSVSTVVAKLVQRRLVARTPAKGDRRRIELRLTAAGERMLRTAPRVPQSRIAEVVAAMRPVQRAQLVRALDGLASAIGASATQPRMLFEDELPAIRRSSRGRRR